MIAIVQTEPSMKRHSEEEIGAKLRQARQLMAGGQSQAQACKELGVSVMTYHRWRRLYHTRQDHDLVGAETAVLAGAALGQGAVAAKRPIDEVRAENERLRRIVTDLLLEKMKAEERIATMPGRKGLRRI
jgi:putative transposase